MDEPTTELDERYSGPGSRPTSWERTRETLEAAQLFWISTVRADGKPHVTPLVAVWLDGAVNFTTGPGEQKALNLSTNQHVVLTTGCDRWQDGLDVMVEGEAQRVTGRTEVARLAAAWTTKWDGNWQFEASDDGFHHADGGLALVYAVQPVKVLAFGKADTGFSHTRHLFQD
ncbi:MAG TPA: pyridoxamine 5'-phosphate oxidase family protein [Jiangellaceae bacterium]|nr:pyridoxamine 5'-phosphate oxidase family protein [Jiangellaceae bacterium]